MKKLSAFIASFIIFFQAPFIITCDISDLRRFFIIVLGCFGLAFCFLHKKARSEFNVIILVPLVYVVLRSVFDFVPGYTIYWLYYVISIFGIILLVGCCEQKYIVTALALSIPIQAVMTYFGLVPWASELNASFHAVGWGSVRHAIRYSTIVYVGLMACWKMYGYKEIWFKFLSVSCAIIGLTTLIQAYSNMVLVVSAVSLAFLLYGKFGRRAVIVYMTGICLGLLFIAPDGFDLDGGRLNLWAQTLTKICDKVVFGHGLWSYALNIGTDPQHPHCEVLHIAYELGIIGLLAAYGVVGMLFLMGLPDYWSSIAIAGVTVSFFTNSGRYEDMAFIWAIVGGICLGNARRIVASANEV